jgi:thiol peroxidase
MSRQVTLKGNPLNVAGPELRPGDVAPDARLRKDLVSDTSIGEHTGVRIYSVVPSLDTPVCADQTRTFNKAIAEMPGVTVYTISCDLPVAQKRFCGAEGINAERMICLSDHKEADFGQKWGTLIPDLRIECRAVFVVGPDNRIRYAEYVQEVANQPNYEAVIAAAKG